MCDHHHLRKTAPAGEIEHVNFLSENIGVLFMNEDYSDIILRVEDKRFHAHKVILASRSEYFRYRHIFAVNVSDKDNEKWKSKL